MYFRRLDYAGVNLLIVGSTFPQMIYSTFCHPLIGYIYLAVIIVTGFTIFIILLCDWIHQPNHRKYKKYLFGGFGVSLIVPMMHALINEKLYGNFDDKFRFSGHVGYFLLLGACYLLGLLIYSVK